MSKDEQIEILETQLELSHKNYNLLNEKYYNLIKIHAKQTKELATIRMCIDFLSQRSK